MQAASSASADRRPAYPGILPVWSLRILSWLKNFVLFILVVWATLAIYYSNVPSQSVRLSLAIGFASFSIWSLWIARERLLIGIFATLFVGVLIWWSTIQPSNDRIWRPEVAVPARASVEGDRIVLTGYRNFDYRTTEDFTVRYETREVALSKLAGVDFYISYWMRGPIGHTFVSFVFEDAPPVSISIEARPEMGEGYAPVASLFKQFELIYIVGDERDLVRVRTNFRREDVHLYRIDSSAENARRLFLVYLERINELADRAEFYHLLSNNCTINIVRYANAAGRQGGFDVRHLLNGLIDGYLYSSGRLDTSLPLEELRRRSRINDTARAAEHRSDFSALIRASLPSRQT